MPQLAFGLYKIPIDGERIILNAIAAGYRHFDAAPIYGNEKTLGRALRQSKIPRSEFFITSKVWNDAVKEGRVRESVDKSLQDVGCDYFDLFLLHWPVPGCFVEAYKELEKLHEEGKLKAIGISNFTPQDHQELEQGGISVPVAVNQIEVSAVLYRKEHVDYFQSKNIVVYASKPLNRAAAFDLPPIANLAAKYHVTSAQIMLRWGLQKGLAMATKTVDPSRMRENRHITEFSLNDQDMKQLDSITTREVIEKRGELEIMRKTSV